MRKICIVLFFFCFGGLHTFAQEENFIALSIYNFTRLINWPATNAANPFVIDVIGHKSIYDKLKDVTEGRKVGNRVITVRFLESSQQVTESEILFVGFWQSKDVATLANKLKGKNTLLIAEKAGMIDAGAGINFIVLNNAIKFEIKRSAVEANGLTISSDLSKMAIKQY